jgi:hypothetical protein
MGKYYENYAHKSTVLYLAIPLIVAAFLLTIPSPRQKSLTSTLG